MNYLNWSIYNGLGWSVCPAFPDIDENGEIVINLAADSENDDWIRSARLLKQGKKVESKPMYIIVKDEKKK
jgi:hypothetical protein